MSSLVSASFTLIGRSSSHFTRIARIFAAELGVDYSFEIVRDLRALEPEAYGGNPALTVPILRSSHGAFFGALNICRALARQSGSKLRLVWPEDLESPLAANAQELVAHAMTTEVSLVMAKISGVDEDAHSSKKKQSLGCVMDWLETHAERALATLPAERDLSYLEVSLYCLVTHLEFRELLPVTPYITLSAFRHRFAERESVKRTAFAFDR